MMDIMNGTIEGVEGIVTSTAVVIKKNPNIHADSTGKVLRCGDKVTVFEEYNGYYAIGEKQWVYANFIKI